MFNKVIGIGLPKTGTSSLAVALNNNNIPTIHFGDPECNEIIDKMYKGIYTYSVLDKYMGITNAFEMLFPQIDHAYPGSKFIYTYRNKESWLVSAKDHWERMLANPVAKPMEIHHHLITFGTYLFNEDRFAWVYDYHSKIVNDYFSSRPGTFLSIDVTKESDYVQKVCLFLDIPIIDATPVHANKG